MSEKAPIIVHTVDDKTHSGMIEGDVEEFSEALFNDLSAINALRLDQRGGATIIPRDKITAITIQEAP